MLIKHQNLLKSANKIQCENDLVAKITQQLRCLTAPASRKSDAKNASEQAVTFTPEWSQAKPFEEIPTLSNFAFIRNMLPGGKFAKLDGAQIIMAMKSELGSISKINGVLGRPNAVFTHNPEDFEKVLRNEGIWPVRPVLNGLSYHRGVHRAEFFQGVEGLIGTQGEQWGSFRSVVNPVLLQPKNVRLYLQKMSQVNKEFLERVIEIRDPHTLEMPATFEDEINRWTLESISIVALDKQLGIIKTNRDNPELNRLLTLLLKFFEYSVDVEFKPPIWKYYKTKSFVKLMETLDAVTDITSKYVEEAFQRIEDNCRNGVTEKPDSEKSVLEKLIKIDKKIAMVMAMDLLMAGVDTTISVFTALLLCLAKNPEKQAKLREEVRKVLLHKNSDFEEAAISNMPYLRACIKEALRVYPLNIGIARLPVNDVVLSGYRVPKGTQVMLVNASLLDSDDHYPRAKEYLPERWLRPSKENEQNKNECPCARRIANPLIYIPFGFGPRSCVGRRITEMEIEIGLARLVRNFNIEFNYPTENAFKSLLIRVPNIPLKFKFSDVEN